jgi:hypothetical protein
MTITLGSPETGRRPEASSRAAWLMAAGTMSLGAGAIHAAAIGVHAEARPAALTFTAVAAVQLAWGGLALVRPNRLVGALGVVTGVAALVGWIMAKTSGIGFVEGLDLVEPVQFVDALAAAMAGLSAVLAGVSLAASPEPRGSGVPRLPLSVVAGFVAAISVFGMATAGTHVHDHGDGEHVETAAGHGHADVPAAGRRPPRTTPTGHTSMARPPTTTPPRTRRWRRCPTTRPSRSTSAASTASPRSSRRQPRTSSPSRCTACRSGPTTTSPRLRASTPSATV